MINYRRNLDGSLSVTRSKEPEVPDSSSRFIRARLTVGGTKPIAVDFETLEIGEPSDDHNLVRTANHGMITGTGCKPPETGKIEYVNTPILRGHEKGSAITLGNKLHEALEDFAELGRPKFGFTERIIDSKKFQIPYMEDAVVQNYNDGSEMHSSEGFKIGCGTLEDSKTIVIGMDFADERDESPTSCYCDAGNAPCGYCTDPSNWCESCDTFFNDCPCPGLEEDGASVDLKKYIIIDDPLCPSRDDEEIPQVIFDGDPPIIKERKEKANRELQLRNKRKATRRAMGL